MGDADKDHASWLRPEDIKHDNAVRKSYKIDASNPGTEVAAETAAALAAASIIFRDIDSKYADLCLVHAKQLFEFADRYRCVIIYYPFKNTRRTYDDNSLLIAFDERHSQLI